MTNTHEATINAMMNLAGGALVLFATITAIISNKLEKAKNAAAKEKIIDTIFGVVYVGLCITGFILLETGFRSISLWFYLVGAFGYVANFLRRSKPSRRIEIFLLVLWFAFLVMQYINLVGSAVEEVDKKATTAIEADLTNQNKTLETIQQGFDRMAEYLNKTNSISKKSSN